MLPIHTILHPTDFSDRSANALTLATQLARDYGARLILLHVAEPPPVIYGEVLLPPEPEETFREARAELNRLAISDATVHVERRFVTGDPATEILQAARTIPADLIVMGTHGRTWLSRLLMGTVAEPVVRAAPCPVLTVSTPFPAPAPVTSVPEELAVAAGGGRKPRSGCGTLNRSPRRTPDYWDELKGARRC